MRLDCLTLAEYPNWFEVTGAKINFERHLERFKGKPVDFLQIGAYTGDASKWMLDTILSHPDSTLTDVDTWRGSDEEQHHAMNFNEVKSVYDAKVEGYDNLKIYKGTSDEFFVENYRDYDFIYIDGDHTAFGAMKDGINGFACLKPQGIIAFDDYQWTEGRGNFYEPRPAIDAFWNIARDKVKIIEVGWQVWFEKTE